MRPITVSIVSHGHGALLPGLLDDLASCPEVEGVILTLNIPELYDALVRPGWLSVVENQHPKGFGANHNAAFRDVRSPFFVVLNPDVRLNGNPFPALLSAMQDDTVALCAPAVVSPSGALEDSARQFPSISNLVLKAVGHYDGRVHYAIGDPARTAPWVAGMFMLLRSAGFTAMGGFDERFFLYYEDVDLCARLWKSGRKVMLCPSAHVIHDARRESHRNPRYMLWHMASMARYFIKHTAYAFHLRNIS